MSRPISSTSQTPALPTKNSFDEVNIAKLGLISVQHDLPENSTRWVSDFMFEGRTVRITCEGTTTYGVPRGLTTRHFGKG
jgi:hypothetical protein